VSGRSWYSGLRCLGCGRRVLVGEDRGLFRCVLDKRGRNVVRAEAICGDCRGAQAPGAPSPSRETSPRPPRPIFPGARGVSVS
jgi:hypothetical protein